MHTTSALKGTWKVGTFHRPSPFGLRPLSKGPVISSASILDKPSNFVAVRYLHVIHHEHKCGVYIYSLVCYLFIITTTMLGRWYTSLLRASDVIHCHQNLTFVHVVRWIV